MRKRSRTTGRQDHPSGLLQTVDDELKKQIRKAMDDKGMNQGDLAAKIPVSPAAITNMFKAGPRQIRFLPKLLEVLELEDQLQVVIENWADLSAELRASIATIVKSGAGKR